MGPNIGPPSSSTFFSFSSLEVVFAFLEAQDDLLKVGRAATALPVLTAARGVPSCAVVGLHWRRERPDKADMQARLSQESGKKQQKQKKAELEYGVIVWSNSIQVSKLVCNPQ